MALIDQKICSKYYVGPNVENFYMVKQKISYINLFDKHMMRLQSNIKNIGKISMSRYCPCYSVRYLSD